MIENQTSTLIFYILAFPNYAEHRSLLSIVFFFLYLFGVTGNLVIITVIYRETHLHTPMYLFLCNLSFIEVCYSTVTLPKLTVILLTGNNSISFLQCFMQLYVFLVLATTEVILFSSMAYDRHAVICKPLHYNLIMNSGKCPVLLVGPWIFGCMNSLFYTVLASHLPFCHSTEINQFFCDIKALLKIACNNTRFTIILLMESLLFGFFPFCFNLMSYGKIIHSILQIKSIDSRRKAFSTCASHLIVLTIFYGTILCVYMRPPSENEGQLDQIFSVLYNAVTPILNPLIYSLQNREIRCPLLRALATKNLFNNK